MSWRSLGSHRCARGLLVLALVGWHAGPLRHQGLGSSKLAGVFTCRGRDLRLSSAIFPQWKCRFSIRIQCEASRGGEASATKLCSKCRSLLPVVEFQRRSRSPDGLQPCCRTCKNQYMKMRRQIQKAANQNRGRPPDDEQVFCPGCQKTLSAAEFSTHLMSLNRLKPRCKACEKLRRRRYAAMNEQRTLPASFPVPSTLKLEEAVGIENARDRNEALSAYGMYFCPRCRRSKSYEAFFRNKHNKHGVTGWCKECIAELRSKKGKTRACMLVE